MKKQWLAILTAALLALTTVFAAGCAKDDKKTEAPETTEAPTTAEEEKTDEEVPSTEEATDEEAPSGDDAAESEEEAEATELGEGAVSFRFTVTDGEGTETAFLIHTDETTVGEALLKLELIEGEESQYGLYVKKVNGILADYDVDQTYWAFYINGEYAQTGVDQTNVEEGAAYGFKVEK